MKLKIPYSPNTLNSYIGYVFKNNVNITMADLRNLQKLIEMSDISIYNGKPKIKRRLEFLQKALEARLNKRFADEGIILNFCKPDIDDPYINEIINNVPAYKKLNYNEIQYITKDITDKLRYGIIQDHKERLVNVLEKIDSQEIESYEHAYLLMNDVIKTMATDLRKIDNEVNNGVVFMSDPDIQSKIDDMISELGRGDGSIITGIKLLNDMLGGGWKPGRLYAFLGVPGGFKSMSLLKAAIDCVRYNAEIYKIKKPGLKPIVIYFSMENTLAETVARTFSMTGAVSQMEMYDSAYVTKRLENMGVINNPNMELLLIYKPNRSVTTEYIRDLIIELEEQGYETCMVVHDYLKRIKPAEKAADEMTELSNVTNELKTIAMEFNIPVIDASQANRVALAAIEQARQAGKSDVGKLITGSTVGSSISVLQNIDCGIALNIEQTADGRKWLSYNRFKIRYGTDKDISYFSQPFEKEGFMLSDDIMLDETLGVFSLSSDLVKVDEAEFISSTRGRRQIGKGKDLPVKDESALSELFNLTPLNKVV